MWATTTVTFELHEGEQEASVGPQALTQSDVYKVLQRLDR